MFMESHAQGWQQWCWEAVLEDHLSFNLSFAPMTSSWLNPWYFSGRSSEFVDETSTRLHWVELRTGCRELNQWFGKKFQIMLT